MYETEEEKQLALRSLTYRCPRTMGEVYGHRKHTIDTGEHGSYGAWFTWAMILLWLATYVVLGVLDDSNIQR